MVLLNKQNFFLIFGLLGVYIAAWYLQLVYGGNANTTWLMHIVREVVDGHAKLSDFIDVSPPLFFCLYWPPVFIAKYFSISSIVALDIYIFALSLLSLIMCNVLLKKLFAKQYLTRNLFLFALVVVFIILPQYDFGDREHLLIIFTLPYFLAVAYRLEGHTINPYYALFVGLFAGFGFAIKPYFLIAPIFVELYYFYVTRQLFSWARTEIAGIVVLMVVYLNSLLTIFPYYLQTVVPLAAQYYYDSVHTNLHNLFLQRIVFFCYAALAFICLTIKNMQHTNLIRVMFVAAIGFFLSYFLQRTIWSDHLLPVFSVIDLLLMIILANVVFETQLTGKNKYFIASGLGALFLFTYYYWMDVCLGVINYRQQHQSLVTYLNTLGQKSIYVFSTKGSDMYPAVAFTRVNYLPRFLHMYWLASMVRKNKMQSQSGQFLMNMIVTDLNTKQPEFVFVDITPHKTYFENTPFNFVDEFSKNNAFQQAWKSYHLVTTINQHSLYAFNVYQRSSL